MRLKYSQGMPRYDDLAKMLDNIHTYIYTHIYVYVYMYVYAV